MFTTGGELHAVDPCSIQRFLEEIVLLEYVQPVIPCETH